MIEDKKKKIKSMIETLINDNKFEDAKLAIEDYRKVVPDDIDVYSMLGVIYILENDCNKAIQIMEKGVAKESNNFDLHYNLGYAFKQINMYKDAFIHYYNAYNNCNNIELREIIKNNIEELKKYIDLLELNDLVKALDSIKKVLFIQDVPCIRTNKIAKVIASKGIQVDLLYVSAHPSQVYKDIELPYKNIFQLQNINEMINYINNSDYDILYSSNEPDYLTVLFISTNKPVIHDTHDMMSLRSHITNEQIVLEHIANVMATGNIYVHELVKDIAVKKFNFNKKPIFVINNFIEKSLIPKSFKKKISSVDGEIHCVFEGGLSNIQGHHRFLEEHFLKLADHKIHVHIYGNVNLDYIRELQSKSKFIHYEGILSPKDLIYEISKYDIGLAFFNINEKNKVFLDTTFANKIFDYLTAGLPIAFIDLKSYRMFNDRYKVGKIIDFNLPLYNQIVEIKNINIDNSFLFKNKMIINDWFVDIIKFLYKVKEQYGVNRNYNIDEFNIQRKKYISNSSEEKVEEIIRLELANERTNFLYEMLAKMHETNGNIRLSNYYNNIINNVRNLKDNCESNKIFEKPNILIIRSLYSVYISEYMKNLYDRLKYKPDLLTFDEKYQSLKNIDVINELIVTTDEQDFIKKIQKLKFYDVIHIHYVTPLFAKYAKQLKSKCEKLIVTIWGSDYYRSDYQVRQLQKILYDEADLITFDNEETMEDFIKFYGNNFINKTTVNRFGLTALEYIDKIRNINKEILKEQYEIPKNSIVVTCGYNATKAHNHIQIIQELNKIKEKLPNNLFFIFPMTYGKEQEYIIEVKELLNKCGFKYKILEDFMNFDEVALYTKITDIMIQVQTTDTLSASMQEQIYSGNIVITGEWLPYKILENKKIFFIKVNKFDELGNKLIEIINNLEYYKEKCKDNPEKIYKLSSWNETIYSWYNSYMMIFDLNYKKDNYQKKYWNQRYENNFSIESSGYMGLGEVYNKYIYKSRVDILNYLGEKILNKFKNKTILELGVGTGYFTNFFLNNDIKSYYGIDISEVAINNLKKQFNKGNFLVGDITNNQFYPKGVTYDVIFSASVLLHMTDDYMLENVIKNISLKLKEEGYFIEIDPITMIRTDIRSDYMRVIDYNKLEKMFNKYGLEIEFNIPITFFLDQPFDYKFIGEKGIIANNIFYKIKSLINNNYLNESNEISKIFYLLDKLCLLKYNCGLSQKLLFVKKTTNKINYSVKINDIWQREYIENEINNIFNEYQYLLNKDEVKDIIELINKIL